MRFTLQTLLLTFVFVWSSMALCGAWIGIVVAVVALGMIGFIRSAGSKRDASFRFFIVFVPLSCAGLWVVLSPACTTPRETMLHFLCRDNLRRIGNALLCYHQTYQCFPPARVVDANGQPMHSWRTLLLPYVDGQAVYDQYDFGEPWNEPTNHTLCQTQSSWPFCCPSDNSLQKPNETNYVAVVGPNTAWPGTECTRIEDLKDGANKTVLLVETIDSKIYWAEPRDLTLDEALQGINPESRPGISSHHVLFPDVFYDEKPGAYALFADGSVHFLPQQITQEDLKALLTRDGGESLDPADLEDRYPPRFRWDRVAALAVFVLSFLLLLLRPRTAKSAV